MNPPITYALCLQHDCPVADKCLRHEAYVKMSGPVRPQITVINPAVTRPGYECEGFHAAMPVRMAYGFQGLLARLPHGNVAAVREAICEHFCQRNYYKMRRGDRPIAPVEQQILAEIFMRYGVEEPITFDRYKEEYDWF